jgi:threonine aldolase
VSKEKIYLASDNWAPAHPAVIKAVVEANEGSTPSYGADPWTRQAEQLIQTAFQSKCKVFIVPTGTGSNVFALKLACRRYESVICSDIAHIHYQEAGSFESIVGCKLLTVPHQSGKITVEAIKRQLKSERAFGKHSTSPRVISIAQPTEVGTVYTLAELASLSDLCKAENLLFHIDGSRLYNAAVALDCSLHELVEASRVDILSLGGTKNGLLGAEALLIFNPELEAGSDHQQKQTLQLLSKMRYLSAQYISFFTDNLWHTLAAQANQRAQQIVAVMKTIPNLIVDYPVESNQIFFTVPAAWIPLIQEKVICYPWDLEKNQMRLIASWNTSAEDVENFENALIEISQIFQLCQEGKSSSLSVVSPMQKTRMSVYGVAMQEGKILTIRQRNGPHTGKLDFPGGGIEFGESAEQALRREFSEEVAMTFDSATLLSNLTAITHVPETLGDEPYTFYQIGMIYRVETLSHLEQEHEELEQIWVDPKDVLEESCAPLFWQFIQNYP